jgi:3-polyprenyl-4-hydroxybenzoate decarboxylase
MKWGAHAPSRVGFDALVETISLMCPIRPARALTDAREARALPPADVLNHATTEMAIGSKLGIDATKKLPGEGHKRGWPPLIRMDENVRKKIDVLLGRIC